MRTSKPSVPDNYEQITLVDLYNRAKTDPKIYEKAFFRMGGTMAGYDWLIAFVSPQAFLQDDGVQHYDIRMIDIWGETSWIQACDPVSAKYTTIYLKP